MLGRSAEWTQLQEPSSLEDSPQETNVVRRNMLPRGQHRLCARYRDRLSWCYAGTDIYKKLVP